MGTRATGHPPAPVIPDPRRGSPDRALARQKRIKKRRRLLKRRETKFFAGLTAAGTRFATARSVAKLARPERPGPEGEEGHPWSRNCSHVSLRSLCCCRRPPQG